MITVNFSPQVDTAKMAGILQELKADPMGGWIELPKKVNAEEIARIKAAAKKIPLSCSAPPRISAGSWKSLNTSPAAAAEFPVS